MTSQVDDPPTYVVLRDHQEYGPFDVTTLKDAVGTGNLVLEDWICKSDRTEVWTSLGELLQRPVIAPPLRVRVRRFMRRGVATLRVCLDSLIRAGRGSLDQSAARIASRPGVVALGCIIVATLIAVLPESPLPLAVPWMLAGFASGVALIFGRRRFRGGLTCIAAILLPVGAFQAVALVSEYFDPNRRETALPPIGEMYSRLERRPVEVQINSSVKSGIPALGLPRPATDLDESR